MEFQLLKLKYYEPLSSVAFNFNLRPCIKVEGPFMDGVTSKDFILHVIGIIGTAGGTGCVIEFAGDAIKVWQCRLTPG